MCRSPAALLHPLFHIDRVNPAPQGETMTEAERLIRAARRSDGTLALGELKRLVLSRRRRRSTLLALEELLAREGLLYAWLHIMGGARAQTSARR